MGRLGLGGGLLGDPVEVDHVQVGVGQGVLGRGLPDGLDAGILRVVVGLGSPGGRLLSLGQVQVRVCDVIVVLDLNGMERRSFRSPRLSPLISTKSGCLFPPGLHLTQP